MTQPRTTTPTDEEIVELPIEELEQVVSDLLRTHESIAEVATDPEVQDKSRDGARAALWFYLGLELGNTRASTESLVNASTILGQRLGVDPTTTL